MDEWVDAPTGSGRWWRRVGDSEPVLCDVTDGEGMNATRVDGVEVLYSARPFAGVKWRRDVPAVTDETTRLHRCAKCGEERSAVESFEGDCYPLCGPCHLELRHEDAAVWRARVDAAERERDDLAAVLETRTAEHALAMARVRELETIIAGRTTPPTDAEIEAHAAAGGGRWLVLTENDFTYDMPDAVSRDEWVRVGVVRWCPCTDDGRPCAWPAADVSRG